MSKNQPEITIHDFQKGFLTLPFDGNQFKDFISSLLGQPQTINKTIIGKFEIHLKDLQNFHDLINQRVTQQNDGQLIQLKAQIFFSDNSSVLLGSLTELITYNEIKPIISQQVILTWTYLIQFSGKNVPEKQEIQLMISASENVYRHHFTRDRYSLSHFSISNDIKGGYFEIEIRHTARSWGNDIEALLKNQIKSILQNPKPLKKIFDRYYNLLALFLIIGLSYAGIYSLSVRNGLYLKNSQQIISPLVKSVNVNDKINYLLNLTTSNHSDFLSQQYSICYFFIVFVSFIISLILISYADFEEESFIVLTRESVKNRDEVLLKQKRLSLTFGVSYILSIIGSIIASSIYAYFIK